MTIKHTKIGAIGGLSSLLCAALSLGCDATAPAGGAAGPGQAGSAGSGPMTSSGGGGGGAAVPAGCAAPGAVVPQRIVRLDYAQLEHSIESLVGAQSLQGAVLEDPKQREFQALFAEGRSVNLDVLRKTLGFAELASGSVQAGFDAFTGCAVSDEPCVQAFLGTFASRAYRRPATADEKASLLQLYTDVKTTFAASPTAGVQEAARYALMGLLSAPGAIYRTELGAPAAGAAETTLTPNEMADLLAYTLLDGPPDQPLLDAAAAGMLATEAQILAQVDRLLQGKAARDNLTAVLLAYYGMKTLDSTQKDPETFPAYTLGLKNSMYAETERFTSNVLWNGKLNDLLTSRTTFVNEGLAALYGIPYPGSPGGDFVQVELPAGQRSGLLTLGSIMATRARTKNTSVVARGLFVNGAVLCIPKPPPPPAAVTEQVNAQLMNETETERQKADYRGKTQPCLSCHANFDPFGLVLENYDGIGRYRAEYAPGVAIDTTTKLPDSVGGGDVQTVAELVAKVTASGTFSSCITANLMKYTLTDASLLEYGDCGIKQTHDQFLQGGQSFSELMRSVLTSRTVTTRSVVKE